MIRFIIVLNLEGTENEVKIWIPYHPT